MTENQKLREALQVARDHIDMDALEISHCKDATLIRQALALPTADHLPDAGKMIEAAEPVGDREAFERTMMDKFGWQRNDFKLDDFGYFDGHTDTAWMAWQARAALSAGDAVDAQRTPLTVLQYNAIPELCAIPPSLYESVVRAIERAHGIDAAMRKEKP